MPQQHEPFVGPRLKRTHHLGQRAFRDRESLTAALRDLEKSAGLFVRVSKGPTVGFATTAIQAGHDAGFTQVTYVPAK